MWITFFILPALAMIAVGIYLYFYIRRSLQFWLSKLSKKTVSRITFIPTILLILIGINIWGIGAVVVIHLAVFVVILDLIQKIIGHKSVKFTTIYTCGLIPILLTIAVLGYGHYNMLHVVQKDYQIKTQKAIREEGYKIALISDLHFGTTMDGKDLISYCNQISEQHPDIVVLDGDIVDEATSLEQMQNCFEVLGDIESNLGIYYVYGNHDRAWYSSTPNFTVDELNKIIEANGIKILEDSYVNVTDDFTIIGKEDASIASQKSDKEMLQGIDKNKFLLYLSHQPVNLEENSRNGYDLMLSGHTHGGQIWPMGVMTDVLGFGEMNYGYRKVNNMQVIVTSGIAGWGYALRTGSHSEYVMIEVKAK